MKCYWKVLLKASICTCLRGLLVWLWPFLLAPSALLTLVLAWITNCMHPFRSVGWNYCPIPKRIISQINQIKTACVNYTIGKNNYIVHTSSAKIWTIRPTYPPISVWKHWNILSFFSFNRERRRTSVTIPRKIYKCQTHLNTKYVRKTAYIWHHDNTRV